MEKRKLWIDQMRGLCMIAILWFHTEMYFVGSEVTPYALYVQDALAGFFFLSGYLFWRDEPESLRHRLSSIFRWLVVPYFFFTTLIAIPKVFVYGHYDGLLPIAGKILCGHASWFVAALIVAEVLFALSLRLFRGRLLPMGLLAVAAMVAAHFVGNEYAPTPLYNKTNFWSVNEALLAFFFLYAGYAYHCYEKAVERQPWRWLAVALLLMLVVLKVLILRGDEKMIFGTICTSCYPLFILDMMVAVLLMVTIVKRLPRVAFLEWTGSHSLVYYFFCGGVPLVVSMMLERVGFAYSGPLSLAVAFVLVYLLATAVAFLFYRYTTIVRRPAGVSG